MYEHPTLEDKPDTRVDEPEPRQEDLDVHVPELDPDVLVLEPPTPVLDLPVPVLEPPTPDGGAAMPPWQRPPVDIELVIEMEIQKRWMERNELMSM